MSKQAIIILIAIFIINPFFGMLSIMVLKIIVNKKESRSDLLLFWFMVLYAILVQSTRIWNTPLLTDWNVGYLKLFLAVENSSFVKYVFQQKDPIWNLLNYIGYYINNGSAFLFLNEIAILTIFLTSLSIFIFWKNTKSSPVTLIASLSLIIFFTEYYGQVNNLLRQYFALSIVTYSYVRKVSLNKSSWFLLIIASLIHYLSFLFLLIYFIKPLYKTIKIKELIKLIGVILIILFLLNNIDFFQNLFSRIKLFGYIIGRLITANNPTVGNLLSSTTIYLNSLVVISISILIISLGNISKSIIFFTNVLIAIMLLSAFLVPVAPEIMSRIYITRFYLFPFTLPYLFTNIKYFHNIYLYFVIVFFFSRFFLTFDSIRGGGFFPPVDQLLMYSIFHFIF